MRKLVAAFFIVALTTATVSYADHQSGHTRPLGPAALHFGAGFPALNDPEWGFRMGGFGGDPTKTRTHVPVIFVHGNNVDAGDWYPVRDAFRAAGWNDQEMFALSYNGLGTDYGSGVLYQNLENDIEHQQMGWDGAAHITGNDVNVPDLDAFILAVRAYTGSEKFSIVAHSLGVTLARKTLKAHDALRQDLVAFVGIAGGNHGTSFCPPETEGNLESCDEIAANTPWLDKLNGPNGSDETYNRGTTAWLTIRDGSGLGDPAFLGTYADSPVLKGAINLAFPGTYHNDLRLDPKIIDIYRSFLENV